jgi:hypothetical protein
LAEDTEGNLYVADTGSGQVIQMTPFGQSNVIATGLSSPIGLAYDSTTNQLFVSETTANRVSAITLAPLCAYTDIDGNGTQDALTDGILIVRYMFGFQGAALTEGAVAPDCTICTDNEIEACLDELLSIP